MLQSRNPQPGTPFQQVIGWCLLVAAVCLIWWLLNLLFPEKMQVLLAAVGAWF